MQPEFSIYEKRGHVAYITINRPEVRNALHAPDSHELAGIWDDFAADDNLWVAVLTGAGDKAFSAGNDLKATAAMGRMTDEQRKAAWPSTGFGGLCTRFDLFKPIIARVNGFALGGGFELALAADIVVAAEHAELGLPEPRRGLFAAAMGVHRLPRQVPLKLAMGYMLTGRHMTATEAHALGVANEVVPYAELDDAVDRWVQDILRCSPLSVRATKQLALEAAALPLTQAQHVEAEWARRLRSSSHVIEGPRAFAEKRDPVWENT